MKNIKKVLLWIVILICFGFIVRRLFDNGGRRNLETFQKMYPKLKERDSVNALIDYIDDGRNFGLRKGSGSPVKIDTIGYYVHVGRDLEHNRYFFQYASAGDWLYKAPDNDTVCLKKKEETYFFLLK